MSATLLALTVPCCGETRGSRDRESDCGHIRICDVEFGSMDVAELSDWWRREFHAGA